MVRGERGGSGQPPFAGRGPDDLEPVPGRVRLDVGDSIAELVDAGFTLAELCHTRQHGIPYGGLTLPQLEFWLERALRRRSRDEAGELARLVMAVQSVMGGEAMTPVRDEIRRLKERGGAGI